MGGKLDLLVPACPTYSTWAICSLQGHKVHLARVSFYSQAYFVH